ncbi:T9SS type A sorting domain-containing protein [Taibaiella koreensis]|uniref:T9SS type A sorting domain-containing protein n=1 Tax=Taibaiella koreensis TaxID=1268548 RepID=UPI000E59CC58|nr:T9SS type A sorting domain-containing protein [Taibaiella koreensis]
MKKHYLILFYLLLLPGLPALAQKVWFSDTTNQWRTSITIAPEGPPGTTIISHYRFKDTVVVLAGYQYHWLEYENGVWVRDDTQAHKVYIRPLPGPGPTRLVATDTHAFVYLDYNLRAGDTLAMPYVVSPATAGDSLSYHVVQSVDSVLMNGLYHKTFQMSAYFPNDSRPARYQVIEGIGNDTGPIFIPDGLGEWDTRLVCFKNQDTIPLSAYSACSDASSVRKLENHRARFDIMPNPATSWLHIVYKGYGGARMNAALLSLTGTSLGEINFSKDGLIDLAGLAPGLYLLQVREDGALLFAEKIMVQ